MRDFRDREVTPDSSKSLLVSLIHLLGHTGVARYGKGKDKPPAAGGGCEAGQQAPAVSPGLDERKEYLVSGKALSVFEGEVRKLRTMQAEALAGYHEVCITRIWVAVCRYPQTNMQSVFATRSWWNCP